MICLGTTHPSDDVDRVSLLTDGTVHCSLTPGLDLLALIAGGEMLVSDIAETSAGAHRTLPRPVLRTVVGMATPQHQPDHLGPCHLDCQ